MNRKEVEYPAELESQFIMRLPDEPAAALREVLKTGENFKNRLSIQIDNDMRHGEVRFDHWLLYGKIVDLPTIVESLKTIDKKSLYKTADICQIMICKEELEPSPTEEEIPSKNKKKDPYKVDKKYLWPHGITPPTKNVRKKRFRKTLKKKSVEAPEIEKEVKRLLRADNEAVSVTWEVIAEDNEQGLYKFKAKKEPHPKTDINKPSKVEDIFGEAVSDSDLDDNVNIDVEDNKNYMFDDQMSNSSSVLVTTDTKDKQYATQFKPEMFQSSLHHKKKAEAEGTYASSTRKAEVTLSAKTSSSPSNSVQQNTGTSMKIQQLTSQIEELKQRKKKTQMEIAGLENMALRQRFQDVLQTLNQDIMKKDIELQKLQKSMKLN